MARLTTLTDEAKITIDTLVGRASGLVSPNLRLGVTGLSRAGKTVFITSLVHNLMQGGRLPLFEPYSAGRIARAYLQPQPDDTVPRFQYEEHLQALSERRIWPDSTRAISELRLTIEYQSASAWGKMFSAGKLSIDIVDYPGEWLLDLPLLGKDYAQFSRDSFELTEQAAHHDFARDWLQQAQQAQPDSDADELTAQSLAKSFTDYLRAGKSDERALSTLPPGRFLMPGDLEGSPALTFAPLPGLETNSFRNGSLAAMMAHRYEAYKTHVVRPFFREHIARLDRQIILVDAMQAINAGTLAIRDLERALTEILSCFRTGRNNFLTGLVHKRIDHILIAATKADHLHHESHDRLEAVVRRLVDRAARKADIAGAKIDVLAMAAIRATREGTVKQNGDILPVIIGTPLAGEQIDGQIFDGETETAIFPGDLPEDIETIFRKADNDTDLATAQSDLRFIRFRPPLVKKTNHGLHLTLPHIRLDRAMQYLFGDRLA